jgi:hypothetical protein
MPRNIRVKKDEENPESPEVLASSLIKIADAFEKLLAGGALNEAAIVALLKDMPGMQTVGKTEIKLVLQNLKKLKSYYVRRPASK